MKRNKIDGDKYTGKSIIAVLTFTISLMLSIVYIRPVFKKPYSEYRSSQLKEVTTSEGNTVRTDYVDENGKITIAANYGFATRIVTTTEEGKIESYYDDYGNPVARLAGYYQSYRIYDENGNMIRVTYLNANGEPMFISGGYAIEERIYNEKNQNIEVRYLDAEGKPICTEFYGCKRLNEYDENGRIRKITYCDENRYPILTSLGYASIRRNYYSSEERFRGKVESEFYLDENDKPIALSLGQYGAHMEYDGDGQISLLTYLDADGNPMITNKGYTTIVRTFQVNDAIATEMYYDLDGKPFSMSEGQYGVNMENGQTRFLDASGNQTFNIRNLLYNHSWIVIIAAIATVFVSSIVGKRENIVLLTLYVIAIAYMTLMFREKGDSKANMDLFWSYKKFFHDSGARADILKNIWLFIPLGAILYEISPKKKMLLISMIISVIIEIVQYFTGTGLCELDDVISNGLGGIVGFMLASQMKDINISDFPHGK